MEKLGLSMIGNPDESVNLQPLGNQKEKGSDALRKAQEELQNNENLFNKFLKGLLVKYDYESQRRGAQASILAGVENNFIKYCQNLPNREIESVVSGFNRNFRRYLDAHKDSPEKILSGPKYNEDKQERVFKERYLEIYNEGIKSIGIINVVEFIKQRKEILNIKPPEEDVLYFENVLDSKYAIDVVVCRVVVEKNKVKIKSMYLVQVKSSEPTEREKDNFVNAHINFVNSDLMDFDAFEDQFSDGIPENLPIEELVKNAEQVGDILLDMSSDPDVQKSPDKFNPNIFISKLQLDFGNLSNMHKAWLLLKYGMTLRERIQKAQIDGIIDESQASAVLEAMDKLEDEIRSKAKMPKDFSNVPEIYSITVAPRADKSSAKLGIVKQEKLLVNEKIVGIAA